MHRIKSWGMGFSPMVLGILISVYVGLGVGQIVMAASFITIPVAIKVEQAALAEQGVEYKNGSPAGNFLAKLLGAVVICCALWLFVSMLVNVVKLGI